MSTVAHALAADRVGLELVVEGRPPDNAACRSLRLAAARDGCPRTPYCLRLGSVDRGATRVSAPRNDAAVGR